jgi:hypothetical protein
MLGIENPCKQGQLLNNQGFGGGAVFFEANYNFSKDTPRLIFTLTGSFTSVSNFELRISYGKNMNNTINLDR